MSDRCIRRLPSELVNKIAAGEVVERPASVVKELVENAIDAETSRIEVTLEDGGKRLIRVVDDGVGMSPADLRLAFESHATSKLAEPDDLFDIQTLGFRGEALASIGSVSRCRIVSRREGAESGAAISCSGGVLGEVKSCGAPVGTIIEVRDLFFNTPARRKFLRTTPTELRHALEAVTRLALPYPALSVHLVHNNRSILKLPRCETQRERLGAVWGDDTCAELVPVHSESSAMTLTGFVSAPGAGAGSSAQYVFLNGRYIRDRAIRRAIAEAYRSRFPAVCLYLLIDAGRVDVNVHPTKVEVRFRDSGAVFAQILTALERALSSAGPVRGAVPPATRSERRERVKTALADFFEKSPRSDRVSVTAQKSSDREPEAGSQKSGLRVEGSGTENQKSEIRDQKPEIPAPVAAPPMPRHCFQLHDAYIVEEVTDGFLLIDQHALHERILYEELKRRAVHTAAPRQRLLVPELIELRPQDFLRIMEIKEELLHMGVEVEAFGERTVAVHAVPHLAGGVNGRELVFEILQDDEATTGPASERQDRIMQTIACKAAVKAGDRLSRGRIEALLDQRDRIGPEPTCPHGRPTTVRFERDDLEKMFQRK